MPESKLDLSRLDAIWPRVVASGSILNALVLASMWGRWSAMAATVGVIVLQSVFNATAKKRFDAGALAHLVANATFNLLMAHLSGWTLAGWLLIPFQVLIADVMEEHLPRFTIPAFIGAAGGVALLDGVPAGQVLVWAAFASGLAFVSAGRAQILRQAREALAARNEALVQTNGALEKALADLDLEKMHKRLAEQEKLSSLGLLAAGIAHEMNNPLAYVASNVRSLQKDLSALARDPELLKEYQEDVVPATLDGIQRVTSIVGDLRRFARGDGVEMQEYDLNREVGAALRIAHNELKYKCQVDVDLAQLPPVLGRPQQIVQVLVNLLTNAAQAIEKKGVVRVETRATPHEVTISVADSGLGMSPETLGRLFQPFFTTKPIGQGMGLGLSVAHGIVKSHGGRLEVQSAPGQGSRFTVHLPIAPPEALGARAA